MTILQLYLARMFIVRWSLVTFGLAALILVLDLLANSESIVEISGASIAAFIRYIFLRLPIIFVRIFPFATLMAALLTLIELTVRRELVAMMSAGASQFTLLRTFAPLAFALTLVDFAVGDQLATRSVTALKAWGVGAYAKTSPAADGAFWIRDGGRIIRIGSAPHSRTLEDLTIFRRNADGVLAEKVNAARAVFRDGGWWLEDVRRQAIDAASVIGAKEMPWPVSFTPASVEDMVADPRDLDLRSLLRLSARSDLGSYPVYVYQVWLQRKFAQPFAIIVIFILAIPLVQRFQRQDGPAVIMLVGFIGGFCYFAMDGVLLSMGAAGLLPPMLAAWAATAIFALLGLTMAMQREML